DPAYGYTYYQNGYSNGSYTTTPSTTYPTTTTQTQPAQTQTAAAQTNGTTGDWLPLGVFALTKKGDTTTTPSMYLQLAMNKQGLLSGTYYNTTTDVSHELEGKVDQTTQKAAWKMANNESSPILETALFNLTQNETPVKVNFTNGNTQDWFMVRVN